MSNPNAALFPMFVKLSGRRCVVVGGGPIGESKVGSLLTSGADVTVVSPKLTERLAEEAQRGTFAWTVRAFEPSDLDGAFLVIAATSDEDTNELIFREADRRGILCNAVDQPPRCHFYFPAVVRRGALQIAISTAGLSPSLAQRLRKELEVEFGPEYEEWLDWLGRIRQTLMERGTDFDTRKRVLARLASREVFDRLQVTSGRKSIQRGAA
jgi:precorrin-2 dehydrogenase / sirohydrochlorin ferrochelatase